MLLIFIFSVLSNDIIHRYTRLEGKGRFCYANSLFQCLNHCTQFSYYFKLEEDISDSFDFLLRDIFIIMETEKGNEYDLTNQYKDLIKKIDHKDLDAKSYNDPLEFLMFILSHRDAKNANIPNIQTEDHNYILKRNYINELFLYKTSTSEDVIFYMDDTKTVYEYFKDKILLIFPKILIINFQILTDIDKLNEIINIQDKHYILNSYIVNVRGHNGHFYSYLRNKELDFCKVNDLNLSDKRKNDNQEKIYMTFYDLEI